MGMTENKNPFKDAIQTDALVVKPGVNYNRFMPTKTC